MQAPRIRPRAADQENETLHWGKEVARIGYGIAPVVGYFDMGFFDIFQQFDAQAAPAHVEPIAIEQPHHAAVYAAAAAELGIDVIVTGAPTAGRSDVADNDVVASVTPDEAVAIIGHYLRMTHNPRVEIQRGTLVGAAPER